MKRSHSVIIGRFEVVVDYEAVLLDYDGSWGMRSEDLGRLELQATITVLSQTELINGNELQFARKAMGLRQPELAVLLDVTAETVSRWETGAKNILRQTQLAVLLFAEHTARFGGPVLVDPTLPRACIAVTKRH